MPSSGDPWMPRPLSDDLATFSGTTVVSLTHGWGWNDGDDRVAGIVEAESGRPSLILGEQDTFTAAGVAPAVAQTEAVAEAVAGYSAYDEGTGVLTYDGSDYRLLLYYQDFGYELRLVGA
jgi:hypothetical protein